jgi:hypothetical protein
MTILHLTPQLDNRAGNRPMVNQLWRNQFNGGIKTGVFVVLGSIAAGFLLGFNTVAQAQAEFGNFGITTPSERFRSEGQNRIEQEIRRLQSPLETDNLLTVDESVQEQLLQLEDPRFRPESLPEDESSDSLGMSVGHGR